VWGGLCLFRKERDAMIASSANGVTRVAVGFSVLWAIIL